MSTRSFAALCTAIFTFFAYPSRLLAAPVGTAFTYQGQLKQGGQDVNATADFQFQLFDLDIGGTATSPIISMNAVSVTDGTFTVDLDFGLASSWNEARWMQIAVRSPAGSGTFTPLSPRQRIRPTPVSHFALSVNGATISNLNASNITSGTLPSSVLTGTYTGAVNFSNASNTFAGNGSALTSLNASSLSSGTLASGRLTGTYSNAVTFNNVANIFAGNGSGLTNLNANNVATGNLDIARMPLGGTWSLTSNLNIANNGITITPTFGFVGINNSSPSWPLHITSNQIVGVRVDSILTGAGQIIGGDFRVAGTGARGVFGWATAATGDTYGVNGRAASPDGRGIFGEATASTGINYGVYGISQSASGRGVMGDADATTGTNFGVYGRAQSTAGRAVYGEALATSGSTYGGMFWSTSTAGTGTFGFASATSGSTKGGWFSASSTSGRGIQVEAGATTGTTYGGYFQAASTSGRALYAESTATSGTTYGVHGVSSSGSGYAIRADNNATTGLAYGLYATTDSTTGFAVRGVAAATSGTATGVYGISNATDGTGVWGVATGSNGWGGRFSGGVRVSGDYYGTGHLWLHAYEGDGSSGTAFIQARDNTTTSNINLRFRTKNGNTLNDIMTLTSGNLVGIGTTVPNSALHVNSPLGINSLRVQNAGTTKLLVHDNGNVMVGNNSTPSATLHVDGGSDVEPASGGYFVIGAVGSTNIGFDNNEIMARSNGTPATLFLNNDGGDVSVSAGGTGRLITRVIQITGGSDLSEQFDIERAEVEPTPGMVVVIDPKKPGQLKPSTIAYDKKVAGIISGAGGVETGMMMGQQGSIADGKHPVALTGRVYCWVDASEEAVEPGDMLTTAATPGHAMKAVDQARSHGAIIGKAMTSMSKGEKGLVLVLVNLQ